MPKVRVRGRGFFYRAAGHNRVPLVFLSGLGADHRAFARSQHYFEAKFRVFTFDARDVGQSDRFSEAYSTADMADDVAGWLDQVSGQPAHVVGHSLGGLIAQELALGHPQQVKSLILVSTHCGADLWRKAVMESWVALKRDLDIGEFTRAVLPWLVAPPFYQHLSQIDGLIEFAQRNPWPQDADAFARQAGAATGHDTRKRIGQIGVPTMVLVGERDIVNPPKVSGELASGLRHARLIVLPDVGHLPHVEDPVRFLREVEQFLVDQER